MEGRWWIYHGDCLEVLKRAPDAYFDSVVSDPPAGIDFMHRDWDDDKGGRAQWIGWMTQVMTECLRVLKPGGHILIWAIPRTSHWTATAIEDAGFEVRDVIHAIQAQGFPKSQDTRKAAIKAGIACACNICDELSNEDLRSLRQDLDSEDTISDVKESNMFDDLRGKTQTQNVSNTKKESTCLSGVRFSDSVQITNDQTDEVLLSSVLRSCESVRSEDAGSSSDDCSKRERQAPSREGAGRSEESCLEGRGDLQEKQRQLPGSEICPLSGGVSVDGAEGRLRDGAPTGHGAVDRSVPQPDGSRSSHRPQHPQQFASEPRTLADQSGAQGGGSWPVCNRCRKPILPEGLGSALKPATEHWILARKPLSESSIARNILQHGTGALNIDGCRVKRASNDVPGWHKTGARGSDGYLESDTFRIKDMSPEEVQARCGNKGRWPTNLVLSHSHDCGEECALNCPVAELDRQSGERPGCKSPSKVKCGSIYRPDQGAIQGQGPIYPDTGGASRFFPTFHYFPKPSRGEREKGLEELPDSTLNRVNPGGLEHEERFKPIQVKNNHPTVKSVALMRWLCRLITPLNGLVLDPFTGSGSTGVACMLEGFRFIGIDQDEHYCEIARRRIMAALPDEENE